MMLKEGDAAQPSVEPARNPNPHARKTVKRRLCRMEVLPGSSETMGGESTREPQGGPWGSPLRQPEDRADACVRDFATRAARTKKILEDGSG
jgi:hypothetical protein